MEVSIMKLDSNTDETTREMLQKLVEKKGNLICSKQDICLLCG